MASNPFGGMVATLASVDTYHRLTLTGQFRWGKHSNREAEATCQCGTVGWYRYSMIKAGTTKSCGCLRKELSTQRLVNGRAALASNPLERTVDGKFKPRVK